MLTVTRALKTELSFNLTETSKYNQVRAEVLLWDRAHQKWSNLVQPQEDSGGGAGHHSGPVHMGIDRTKGKSGKSGKGKSDKGSSKGKQKGKRKDKGKSKGFYNDKGGQIGEGKGAQNHGKGKTGKADKACVVCGQQGHFAKDCWQAVRNVQSTNSDVASSATEWAHVTGVSQALGNSSASQQAQQGQAPQQNHQAQQTIQYRVSRIAELNSHENHSQEQLVFDLRESPKSTPKSNAGSVTTIHHYIGDDRDTNIQSGQVRAIVSEVLDDAGDLYNILLGSGGGAAVFPSFARCGTETYEQSARMHDAQGREISVQAIRDVKIRLLDQ